MTIKETIAEDKVILSLNGRLDSNTSGLLHAALEPIWAAGDKNISLDVSELQYISSAGLRILLMSQKKCKANDKRMTISGANAAISEIFDIVGFSSVLEFE